MTSNDHSPKPASSRTAAANAGTLSGDLTRRRALQGLAAGAAGAGLAHLPIREAQAAPSDERYERGLNVLRKIGGDGYDVPIKKLAGTSPDLARFTVEYPYGDVLSRPGLELKLRQIVTVSSLLAQGSAQPQLKYHLNGLLNAGATPQELVELLFVAIAILGFPPAINTASIVREIFKERGVQFTALPRASDDGAQRYQKGAALLEKLGAGNPATGLDDFAALSPELANWTVEFVYGEALLREGLDARTKQIAICSMLATCGNRVKALQFHIASALNAGVSRAELTEVFIQLSVYAGFPAALNAFAAASPMFAERDAPSAKPASAPMSATRLSETGEARRKRGVETLGATSGASGETVIRSFDDLAPDLGVMLVEHAYGDVFSRTGLDRKTRELASCSAMAALGTRTAETPLRVHINAALAVGATEAEIVETLLNLAPYCGYPAVQQAMRIAGEEFGKRKK